MDEEKGSSRGPQAVVHKLYFPLIGVQESVYKSQVERREERERIEEEDWWRMGRSWWSVRLTTYAV